MPADSNRNDRLHPFFRDLESKDIPSEYARPNQTLFQSVHGYEAVDGALPGLAGTTYDGERHLLPFFDAARIADRDLDELIGERGCLYPIAHHTAERLARRGFAIHYSENDSDYVFATSAFETYAGRALHSKRNLFKQFLAQSEPRSDSIAGQEGAAFAVLNGWLGDVGKSAAASDFGPCSQAIRALAGLGLTGRITLTAAGQPAGFVIASRLGSDCAVIHFAKGRRAFNGVYPFMFSDFVRHHPDIRWLNFEQDLGNPGFRQNKQSFAPHHRIAKYRIRRRPATCR